MPFIKLITFMFFISLHLSAHALTFVGEGRSIASYPGEPEVNDSHHQRKEIDLRKQSIRPTSNVESKQE